MSVLLLEEAFGSLFGQVGSSNLNNGLWELLGLLLHVLFEGVWVTVVLSHSA